MKKVFKIFLAIFGLGVLAFSLLCLFIISLLKESVVESIPFNSPSWKNEQLGSFENPIKLKMVDDLLEKYQLEGMSKNAINELLGIPESTNYFRSYDYVYWLGPERGPFGIDSEWLCIKFQDDIVIEAALLTD